MLYCSLIEPAIPASCISFSYPEQIVVFRFVPANGIVTIEAVNTGLCNEKFNFVISKPAASKDGRSSFFRVI